MGTFQFQLIRREAERERERERERDEERFEGQLIWNYFVQIGFKFRVQLVPN